MAPHPLKTLTCSLFALVLGLAGCATQEESDPSVAAPGAKPAVPALKVVGVSSDDTDTGVAPKTTLWGVDYVGLRGRAPFFVPIPGTRKLLFVTPVSASAELTVVHVADFDTKTILNIPAPQATDVGSNIGLEGEALEPEKVISATDHVIILEDVYAGGTRRYTIDLDAKTVTGTWIRAATAK